MTAYAQQAHKFLTAANVQSAPKRFSLLPEFTSMTEKELR